MHFDRLASISDFFYYRNIKKKRKANKDIYDANPRWEMRKNILKYYKMNKPDNEELKEAINYIRKEGIHIFPYPFREKYDLKTIEVYEDAASALKYVKHNSYNLYFPYELENSKIQDMYNSLLIEQDLHSPHCYLSESFNLSSDDILLDIGAAEGILSLSVIDKVHKVLLFEVEEMWIKALTKTFEPWRDKVEIINKYVSDTNSADTVTIDSLKDKLDTKSIFLKIDVEGAEKNVLQGAMNVITSDDYKCKLAICTYHKQQDYGELSALMSNLDYSIETSCGYMLFYYDPSLSAPYFRRALIRCQKEIATD